LATLFKGGQLAGMWPATVLSVTSGSVQEKCSSLKFPPTDHNKR